MLGGRQKRASGSTRKPQNSRKPKAKKAPSIVGTVIKRSLFTFFIVMVITGSIVAVALSVMVLRLVNTSETITIDKENLTFTSILYSTDPDTGDKTEMQRVFSGENSIWMDFADIPDFAKKAAVAVEDQRFYQHGGVDWKRTVAVTLKFLVPGTTSLQGGSTINQQVIKNITGKKEVRVDRKVQEIFSALNMDNDYSKDEILEAYLNVIPLGNNTRGIEAASQFYFGKSAKDLNLEESASLVGITKNPTKNDPIREPEANLQRRQHILNQMLDQKMITQAERDDAYTAELKLDLNEDGAKTTQTVSSYFEDAVIEEVIKIFMDSYGYTRQKASEELFTGGYKINTTMNSKIQSVMEDMYKNEYRRMYSSLKGIDRKEHQPVDGASVLTDVNGNVLALVGGVGEKTQSRDLNRATMTKRSPGSTMKPLSPYALAIEDNLITYSSVYEDKLLKINKGGTIWSPRNYYEGYDGRMTVSEAFRRSVNTVAVQVTEKVGPARSFNFMKYEVGVSTLIDSMTTSSGTVVSDIDISPMSLGALTDGVTLMDWTGAYQIFMNGGFYTKPYLVESIYNSNDELVFEPDINPVQVISDETAHILNQLMQEVVYGVRGTGAYAAGVPAKVAGKTGTTNDNKDLWFMGGTPNYVLSVWIGYDRQKAIGYNAPYTPVVTWTELMKEVEKVAPSTDKFPEAATIERVAFCSITGEEARDTCPAGGNGYYRPSNLPPLCTGHYLGGDYEYDEEGNLRDSAGNLVDEEGNIIDEEGNIIEYRNNDGDDDGDDDDDTNGNSSGSDSGSDSSSSNDGYIPIDDRTDFGYNLKIRKINLLRIFAR